jgi:hypothetical protein
MALITSDNVPQRPQWRITPLGRLVHPMHMRPARPLNPPLEYLRTKIVEKGTRKKRSARILHRRRRADRISIRCAGAARISGIFLDGNGNALPPVHTGPEGDGCAKGKSVEVDEVEHILEVSDQTPSGDDKMHPGASDTELDLAAERASTLDLLSAMFGEANDWGGAESIISDVNVEMTDIPHPPSGSFEPTDFKVIPAAHEPRASQREEKNTAVDRQTEATPTHATTTPAHPSTQNKLKDMFAPREEEGKLFAIHGVVSLTRPAPFFHRLLPYRPPRS